LKYRKVDKGKVSNIRCQHPKCKTHPKLRVIYYVEVGGEEVPVGSECLKKGLWKPQPKLEDF